MILLWIAYAMLFAAGLAVAGACLDFAIGGRIWARRALWTPILLLSAAGPVLGGIAVGTPGATGATVPSAAAPSSHSPAMMIPDRAVLAAWAFVSGAALLGLVLLNFRLGRRLRSSRREIVAGQAVLVSNHIGPAVVGIRPPRIVLPEWVMALPDDQRDLVVAHEAEHLRAGDHRLALLALLVVTLFPWNPALWWTLHRLRLAIELDCDGRVVQRHRHDRRRYCELLVAARHHSARHAAPSLTLTPMRSALGKRIEAILNPRGHRDRRTRFAAFATTVGLTTALGSLPAAPLASIPSGAEIAAAPGFAAVSDSGAAATAGQSLREAVPALHEAPRAAAERPLAPPSLPAIATTAARVDETAIRVDPVLRSPPVPPPAAPAGVVRAAGTGGSARLTARPINASAATATFTPGSTIRARPDTIRPPNR